MTRISEGQHMLETAARRAGIHAPLREAMTRLPTANAFLQRLAFYLTPQLPHPAGLPLLDLSLRTAMAYYRDRREAGEARPGMLFMEFVAGIFTPLPAMVEIRVHTVHATWDPLQGEPLTTWLATHPGAKMRDGELVEAVAAMAPRAIRTALAFHLLDPRNLAHLPEGALTTIVDYPGR